MEDDRLREGADRLWEEGMSGIAVGDLVVVARGMPCCGHRTGAEGSIFVVSAIEPYAQEICISCKAPLPLPTAFGHRGGKGFDLPRLRRIPPLSELDEAEHKEETPA
jgi:hypothetical protein